MIKKTEETNGHYDIIGDIHGHADKLESLLRKLGYAMKNGIYQHNDRTAVFVGDLIDRGTQNRRVLEIVRPMVEYGHAHVVMGNHEYNAICYHTRKSATDWLRPHTQNKFKQHEAFLREYPFGHSDTNEVITWFKPLPLFLDFNDFRVIHACWDDAMIREAKVKYLHKDNRLKKEYLAESSSTGSDLFEIIERLLKGVEVKLPPGCSFRAKGGQKRHHIRVKWWGEPGQSYKDIAFGYGEAADTFPPDQSPASSEIPSYSKDEKPVFFGHYWKTGTQNLQQENLCCVDYSAGNGRNLVCYSFRNRNDFVKLNEENFTWCTR